MAYLRGDATNASGVSIPKEIMDEFVVMRLAQLLREGKLHETIARAIEDQNFGSNALRGDYREIGRLCWAINLKSKAYLPRKSGNPFHFSHEWR